MRICTCLFIVEAQSSLVKIIFTLSSVLLLVIDCSSDSVGGSAHWISSIARTNGGSTVDAALRKPVITLVKRTTASFGDNGGRSGCFPMRCSTSGRISLMSFISEPSSESKVDLNASILSGCELSIFWTKYCSDLIIGPKTVVVPRCS